MSLSADFVQELQCIVSGDLRTDAVTRTLYSTDASVYQIMPRGVFIPRNQEELQAAVELAAKYKIPLLPRGSGSSLAGQAIGDALILDLSRYLDRVLEVNPAAQTATVEPGVTLLTLNGIAAEYGLGFGPDPASADRATMGGVIANNATGAHSIRYGMAADHILSAEVLLADGSQALLGEVSLARAAQIARDAQSTAGFSLSALSAPNLEATLYAAALHLRTAKAESIRRNWVKTWRNASGYRLNYLLPWSPSRPPQWDAARYPNLDPSALNLAPLLAGSEGTLALMQRITVRLVPLPREKVLAVMPFKSIVAAVEAVPSILAQHPSAVELLPRSLLALARQVPAYARLIDFAEDDSSDLLIVEFSGADSALLRKQARGLGRNVRIVTDAEKQAQIWRVRKVGLGILSTAKSARRGITFIEDCAVPVEHLGEYVRGMERIFAEHRTSGVFYAHASAGCLHMRPVLNLKSERGRRELREIAEAALELVLSLGGAMSGEHGDGLSRAEFLKKTYGEELTAAFRLLKNAADPHGLLNPGKIVSPLPMDANLRYGADYRAEPFTPAPVLDFSSQGGLVNAIEQCNGAGVCRKFDGTMCPSFQATREESHATRGRANLLRAMISAGDALAEKSRLEEAVAASLDLCLACKGCKSECPSGVDMAKLKYEFFNRYYRSHRRKGRDYLFGYIGVLARFGASFGKVVNWGLENRVAGALVKKMFGIAPERSLPKFGNRKLAAARLPARPPDSATVLYLPDAFTRYFEPEIEQAALTVLRAAGLRVIVLPILGAGRTLISKSFLGDAKKHAQALRAAIRQVDAEGRYPVVGAEPSEIYTLKDEYLDFFPHDAEMQALAARSYFADEFLLRPFPTSSPSTPVLRIADNIKQKKRGNTFSQKTSLTKISLHGHCYQKARPPAADGLPVGQDATAAMLRAVGYEVEVIPSGCCGMAGAFGYEKEHYELSMQVGELVLFPTIRQERALNGEVSVCAPGASCREQIVDGTGVTAQHPLVLIARLLS